MHGQQAKIVSPTQEQAMRGSLATTRYPSRDRVMFLLSIKVGLCANEMVSLTWTMVTDAPGQVAEVMHVAYCASKGTTGDRTPASQAGVEALERSLVFYVIDAGVAVTWFRPEAMALRGIRSILAILAETTKHGRRVHEI